MLARRIRLTAMIAILTLHLLGLVVADQTAITADIIRAMNARMDAMEMEISSLVRM